MSKPTKLTERQQRFVEAYAISGNGTQAAKKAGYRKPAEEASRLLRNAKVAEALAVFGQKRTSKAIATAEKRHEFWTRVFTGKVKNTSMRDRLKASELLGKAQGDFVERREISGDVNVAVRIYVPKNGRDDIPG